MLLSIGSTALADSIASYTVTDLGIGNATLSAATGADATLTAPDGRTVYAFPRTDNSVADANSLIAKFPTLIKPPELPDVAYGDPANVYRNYTWPVFLNANGVAAVSEVSGVSGHIADAMSAVDTYQRQPDGSYSRTPYSSGISSPNNFSTMGVIAQTMDLNNRDQILGMGVKFDYGPFASTYPIFTLTDLDKGISTDLQTLLPYPLDRFDGYKLDDQGRILVYGDITTSPGDVQQHAFLLTPAGLSTAPIATPEPSAMVTLGVASAGLLARRRWGRAARN